MATIDMIQNIIQNGKPGQFITIKVSDDKSDLVARVVNLDPENFGTVKAEEWTEGWVPNGEIDNPSDDNDDVETSDLLCFTAQEDGSSIALMPSYYNPFEDDWDFSWCGNKFQYSYDGLNWINFDQPYNTSTNIITLNTGDKIYIRNGITTSSLNYEMGDYYSGIRFRMEGKIAASGNINYMLDPNADISHNGYSDLTFYSLFSSCRSLTQAPELPATILAYSCYKGMFKYCSSLTQAPKLPATTLTNYCYNDMFTGCDNVAEVQMKNAVNPYDYKTYGYLKRGGSYPNYTESMNIKYVD